MYKSDKALMNQYNYLLNKTELIGDVEYRFEKTANAYKAVAYKANKSIGRAYLFHFVEDKALHLGRVHVSTEYRNKGIASNILSKLIGSFGSDFDIVLYASPNRIDKDADIEEYRNKLFTLYSKFGFERIEGTKSKMIRKRKEFI